MENPAAVILTGGRSSRMGRDKAFLPISGGSSGHTFLSSAISMLEGYPTVYLSVAAENIKYRGFGLPQIVDLWPDIGPMGGIASALSVLGGGSVLALACDTPFITRDVIDTLAAEHGRRPDAGCICFTDAAGRPEPLCAVYTQAALPVMLKMIDMEEYALRTLMERLDTVKIPLDPEAARKTSFNINTPDEYSKFVNKL